VSDRFVFPGRIIIRAGSVSDRWLFGAGSVSDRFTFTRSLTLPALKEHSRL
jgi:hypothetical protein